MPDDLYYLQLALDDARASAAAGEVPIGAVLVHNDAVLVRSGNRTIRDNDPTAHAEIIVIREAARLLGNYRLAGTVLYVTLEPCAMCAGAIVQARVSRLVYAASRATGVGAVSRPRGRHFSGGVRVFALCCKARGGMGKRSLPVRRLQRFPTHG